MAPAQIQEFPIDHQSQFCEIVVGEDHGCFGAGATKGGHLLMQPCDFLGATILKLEIPFTAQYVIQVRSQIPWPVLVLDQPTHLSCEHGLDLDRDLLGHDQIFTFQDEIIPFPMKGRPMRTGTGFDPFAHSPSGPNPTTP